MKTRTHSIIATVVIFGVSIIALGIMLVSEGGTDPRVIEADKCTQADWDKNNCVPANRCTPPGDPREATIDCVLTPYDHKFMSE